MTDTEIIALCWQRNEAAIPNMIEKYDIYCTAIARRILSQRQDVEECVNDTWLGAWNAMPPKRPDCLRIFLGRITRNLSIDRLRRAGAQKRSGDEAAAVFDELEHCLSGGNSPEDALIARDLSDSVNRFLKKLSQRDCNIFLRRYFYLESPLEIASRYRISVNLVNVSLHRTRKKLRKALEQEGYL